jgi:hypothetical protein
MRNRDDILQRAKQLKRSELAWLIAQLDAYLEASAKKTAPRKKRPLYAGTLSIAGMARSDYTDVSTNKKKHLAEIYATKHFDR